MFLGIPYNHKVVFLSGKMRGEGGFAPLESIAMSKVIFVVVSGDREGLLSFHGQRPRKVLDILHSTGQQ